MPRYEDLSETGYVSVQYADHIIVVASTFSVCDRAGNFPGVIDQASRVKLKDPETYKSPSGFAQYRNLPVVHGVQQGRNAASPRRGGQIECFVSGWLF